MKDTSPSVVSGMLLAGKYRVDRLLGEGGMGVVLAATNEALRQRVAIKLLRSGALANAKALGRFEREARAAASLRSEHVARVLDVGKLEDGRPYMVMEYLEGRDLGDVIDHGPLLPVTDAVGFVLQACEAIAEAHSVGIIHRDLKPKNLFLASTVDGRPLVKVLDFGISKMDNPAEDMSLTRTTEIIGSPSYMSPEQLRASKAVDVRTDIWALGVILYELLTKKVPFQATTITELVAVVLTEPVPDIRLDRPDVPPALAHAIERCLSKKRDDRFSSVAELVRTIGGFGGSEVVTLVDRVSRVAEGSARSLDAGGGHTALLSSAPVRAAGAANVSTADRGVDPALRTGPPSKDGILPASRRATRADVDAPLPPPNASGPPIAAGSARPPTSSARLAINGGQSVAWGETQVDPAPSHREGESKRRAWYSRTAPLLAAAAALLLLLGAVGTGAVMYVKHAHATPAPATAPASPTTVLPLPENRKDLGPMSSTTAAQVAAAPTTAEATPSSLPTTRAPTSASGTAVTPGPTAATSPTGTTRLPTKGTTLGTTNRNANPNPTANANGNGLPPAPAVAADDLDHIGRR